MQRGGTMDQEEEADQELQMALRMSEQQQQQAMDVPQVSLCCTSTVHSYEQVSEEDEMQAAIALSLAGGGPSTASGGPVTAGPKAGAGEGGWGQRMAQQEEQEERSYREEAERAAREEVRRGHWQSDTTGLAGHCT